MSAGPAPAHRHTTRRAPAPRAPRRVSGPARGRVRPQAAGTVALPQPSQPVAPRLADVLVRLPDAWWLDRLMRGRAWIALIAVGLIGLVFMQVSMLGMNAGIGQAVERSAALELENSALAAENNRLSNPERIQRLATAAGFRAPNAGDVVYLRSRGAGADAAKAARTMTAPDPNALANANAAAAATAAATTDQATTVPPTDAAQQAQAEEQAQAGSVPGAADPAAQAQAQTPVAPQAQAQPQTQSAPTTGGAATSTPQTGGQATTQQQPTDVAQTQQQPTPQATGATAAPGQ